MVDECYDSAGSTNYDGLAGISAEVLSDYSELLVSAWYDAGDLEKEMFSTMYFSDEDTSDTTYIYFGGYESDFAESDDDITWFDLTGSGFWEIDGTDVFYGDSKSSLGYFEKAIIDTGASAAYIDEDILSNIIDATGLDCSEDDGQWICECDGVDDFDDLYFGFGDGHDTVRA